MDIKQMMVSVVYESPDGLVPLEVVDAMAHRFGVQCTTRQVLQTATAHPRLFVESGGRVRRPADSPSEMADSSMDLKEMMVAVVYQNPDGLVPLEVVEGLARRFGVQTNTRQVLQTVRAHPRLFVETGGRLRSPSGSPSEVAAPKMDLKEMMVAVVYESPDGLVPLEVVEAVSRRFGATSNTKQVLKAVRANPKLFVETEGRVTRPSDSTSELADSKMDLKEMMVAVVYDSPDGLVPLEVVEALTRRFGAQSTTKQVLKAVRANPRLFVETYGRVSRPAGYS
jgi:hypothetical protein